MTSADELYTTGDVAKLLKISTVTVFRAIEKKQLRASTTPGGHYRVSRADLEDYMVKNNVDKSRLEPRTWRVLVVEDNQAEQRLLQKSIGQEARYDVRVTHSGYEAGFLTKQFKPDLIILDVFLGDADGRQIARLIRSDPGLQNMKIVAISSTRDAGVIQEIWDSGVDAFLTKPLGPDQVLDQVRKLLK